MKSGLSVVLAVTLALVTATADAQTSGAVSAAKGAVEVPTLKVIGPVESFDAKHGVARVLGQTVVLHPAQQVTVGDVVSVVGTTAADGSITASILSDKGLYIAGASKIFLTGNVQKVNSALGTATVNGVTVDFTSLLANTQVAPKVGSAVQIGGTQPAVGGVVLASVVSSDFVDWQQTAAGVGTSSISGVGASSISGVGKSSISGVGASSISGVGKSSISGVGASSISGVGKSSISGVGASSISGVGKSSISGVGANSISGVGMASISGVGASSISGVGLDQGRPGGGVPH
jgi:hypothetical protein